MDKLFQCKQSAQDGPPRPGMAGYTETSEMWPAVQIPPFVSFACFNNSLVRLICQVS